MNSTNAQLIAKSVKKIDFPAAKTAICATLKTPRIVADRLGLLAGAKIDGQALQARCPGPGHTGGDQNPSLRIYTSDDGSTVSGHCFSCGWHGSNPIAIVAAVKLGLWGDLKGKDWTAAINESATVAGVVLDRFLAQKGRPKKVMVEAVRAEMAEIRSRALPLCTVPEGRTTPGWHAGVAAGLQARGLDPAVLDSRRYGKDPAPENAIFSVLGADLTNNHDSKVVAAISRREGHWAATGHHFLVPMFSAGGALAGLVGRSLCGGEPKSLTATGSVIQGTVGANILGKSTLGGRDNFTEKWQKHRDQNQSLPSYPKVIICEGEMDFASVMVTDAAERSIVFFVKSGSWDATIAACVPTGSEVYILTHSDGAGTKYRDEIAKTLTGRKIYVRHAGPPTDEKLPDENDRLMADLKGYSPTVGCVPYEPTTEALEAPAATGKEPAADTLLALAVAAEPEFLIDLDSGEPYLAVADGPVRTSYPAQGEDVSVWLRGVWDDAYPTKALKKADLSSVLETLAARACRKGKRATVHRRVGTPGTKMEEIYLDLCDGSGDAIKITKFDVTTTGAPRCAFARPRAQLPLPRPQLVPQEQRGAVWDEFFSLVRVPVARRPQVVGWLLASMLPKGPYPLVVFGGEAGSAKSTSARILCSVVDPSSIRRRKQPEDDQAMTVAAKHAHILDYDNLSSVPSWMSDLLCQFSTGGADTRRKLFSDSDEKVVSFSRPVVLTGIPDLATRGDLLDRSILIHLDPIPATERLTESEIDRGWRELHPKVLGILCEGIRKYLSDGPATLKSAPRLADFYAMAEAAIEVCGFEPGSVVAAHAATQGESEFAILSENEVFKALDSLLDPSVIHGEATDGEIPNLTPVLLGRMGDILDKIKSRCSPGAKIPQGGNGLENWFRRNGQALRGAGLHLAQGARTSRGQNWLVWRGGAVAPAPGEYFAV